MIGMKPYLLGVSANLLSWITELKELAITISPADVSSGPRAALLSDAALARNSHCYRLSRVPEENDIGEPARGRQKGLGVSLPVYYRCERRVVDPPGAGRGDVHANRGRISADGAPLGVAIRTNGDRARSAARQHRHRIERHVHEAAEAGPLHAVPHHDVEVIQIAPGQRRNDEHHRGDGIAGRR